MGDAERKLTEAASSAGVGTAGSDGLLQQTVETETSRDFFQTDKEERTLTCGVHQPGNGVNRCCHVGKEL